MEEKTTYDYWGLHVARFVAVEARLMDAVTLGAFISLCFEDWLTDGLPVDAEDLRLLARCSEAQWEAVWRVLQKKITLKDGKFVMSVVEDGRYRAKLLSDRAKKAADARWGNTQQSEPVTDAQASSKHSLGDAKKERKKEKKEISLENPRKNEYPPSFEEFWRLWRELKSPRGDNKIGAFASWNKCLTRGVDSKEIVSGLCSYKAAIEARLEKQPDAREFIPMTETWLNKSRWTIEYPDELKIELIGKPKDGVDLHWCSYTDEKGYEFHGRFWIENGIKTDKPFDEAEWIERKMQKGELSNA